MAGTPTPNYNWPVPANGGDASIWGTELIAQAAAIDATVFANAAAANSFATTAAATAAAAAQAAAEAASNVLMTFASFQLQFASGTSSGETWAGGAYVQRVLNTTVFNSIVGASLAANQITLPAGTYEFIIAAPWVSTTTSAERGASRLRNVTDSTTVLVSQPCLTQDSSSASGSCVNAMVGHVTIAGTKVFEVDTYVSGGGAIGGEASTTGEIEVYTTVYIRKVA